MAPKPLVAPKPVIPKPRPSPGVNISPNAPKQTIPVKPKQPNIKPNAPNSKANPSKPTSPMNTALAGGAGLVGLGGAGYLGLQGAFQTAGNAFVLSEGIEAIQDVANNAITSITENPVNLAIVVGVIGLFVFGLPK
jgi:hypothetical protein